MILDGNVAARHIKANIARVNKENPQYRKPHLAIIQVGDNPASNTYVKWKQRDATECGIETSLHYFSHSGEYIVDRLIDLIKQLNATDTVDGIMVQLPILGLEGPGDKYYVDKICDTIAAEKDVDGMNFGSEHRFFSAPEGFPPCTPDGIRMLLNYYKIDPEGKKCVVVGRSKLVGYPTAKVLLDMGGTVCICHSKTEGYRMKKEVFEADIIVSAVGKAGMFNENDLNLVRHPVVIDVGTSVGADGKLHGDFNLDLLDHCNEHNLIDFTPVPGGVGPMTRAALMAHVQDAFIYRMRKAGKYVQNNARVRRSNN